MTRPLTPPVFADFDDSTEETTAPIPHQTTDQLAALWLAQLAEPTTTRPAFPGGRL